MSEAAAATFNSGQGGAGTSPETATASSVLSGTTQALGTLARFEGAKSQALSLEQQAGLEDIRAERETTRGRQKANNIREELLRNLAAQQAAGGTSGLSRGSDALTTGVSESLEQGEREINLTQRSAQTRSQARRLRSFRLRQEAGFTRDSAKVQRNLGLLGAFSDVAARGFAGGA